MEVQRHDDSYEYLGQMLPIFCLGRRTCFCPFRKTMVSEFVRFCCTFRGDLFVSFF